jgi:hypothetical protein
MFEQEMHYKGVRFRLPHDLEGKTRAITQIFAQKLSEEIYSFAENMYGM